MPAISIVYMYSQKAKQRLVSLLIGISLNIAPLIHRLITFAACLWNLRYDMQRNFGVEIYQFYKNFYGKLDKIAHWNIYTVTRRRGTK